MLLALCVVAFCFGVCYNLWRRGWHSCQGGAILILLYAIAGSYWFYCWCYYTKSGHDMPQVVYILRSICMFFTAAVTLVLFVIALSLLPNDSVFWLCLLFLEILK